MNSNPIGIFDSGIGGFSVWREAASLLPGESFIYLADQAHVPYGPRPLEEIRRFSEAITAHFLALGCKTVVMACNTASAAALHQMREKFPQIPFVGMEPAVKPAASTSERGAVGVIATKATFQGKLFASVVERFAKSVKVHNAVCPGLVEMIEAGETDSPRLEEKLREWLSPLLAADIDRLVLGCTHYPLAKEAIARVAGAKVKVVDPSPAVAKQIKRVLEERAWLAPADNHPRQQFLTTAADTARFASQVKRFCGDFQAARIRWDAQDNALEAETGKA